LAVGPDAGEPSNWCVEHNVVRAGDRLSGMTLFLHDI